MSVLSLAPHMLTHALCRGRRRLGPLPALLTIATALSLAVACDRVPLLAPAGTVITVLPSSTNVATNGQIEIVATVIENGVTQTPTTPTTPGTPTTPTT